MVSLLKKVARYYEKLNIERIKRARYLTSKQLIRSFSEGHKVIFLDETSIHLGVKPFYAWVKGKKISIPVQNKSKNYSIVTAIIPSKILGCQIIKGGVKQHDFLCFVSNLVNIVN